jgi:hypothetical protein
MNYSFYQTKTCQLRGCQLLNIKGSSDLMQSQLGNQPITEDERAGWCHPIAGSWDEQDHRKFAWAHVSTRADQRESSAHFSIFRPFKSFQSTWMLLLIPNKQSSFYTTRPEQVTLWPVVCNTTIQPIPEVKNFLLGSSWRRTDRRTSFSTFRQN